MVIKGEEESVQAATQEETAVVFTAKAHRRETEGEGLPVLPGGKLPNDGVEQCARGGARTATFLAGEPTRAAVIRPG